MAIALITAFLQAKMSDAKTSVALYSVSSGVDGAKIVQQMQTRSHEAIVRMLATASEPLTADPQLVAFMLEGAMVGVSGDCLNRARLEKNSRPCGGNSSSLPART
jgi:hypothetical protein